jgi:predicted DNA-binding WGR domain protein
MPKRYQKPPARPAPIQLPLFAEAASLVRVRPERNEWRFYRLEVWPDLFGRALLLRQWGRIGTEGRRRLDLHPDAGAAANALAQLASAKRRRGYQDRVA